MKLCVSALLLILVPALITGQVTQCSSDDILKSIVAQYCGSANLCGGNQKMECTSINRRGSYASCPAGYAVTGCSCGMGCGSWDIQASMTCHCQCAIMDWTTAVCCRI